MGGVCQRCAAAEVERWQPEPGGAPATVAERCRPDARECGRQSAAASRRLQGCADGQGCEEEEEVRHDSSKTGKGGAVPQAEVAGNGALPAEQVTPDAKLSGKAAKKAEKKRKKAAKARGDKAVEPVTWSDVLRVGPGFSLADLDPASTPGLPRGQGRRRGRHG